MNEAYMTQILKRITQLKTGLTQIELQALKSHARTKVEGATTNKTLQLSKRKKSWQYYIVSTQERPTQRRTAQEHTSQENQTRRKTKKYVPGTQLDMARAIVQRDYDEQVLRTTRKWMEQLSRAEKILQSIPENLVADLHQPKNLHPARRALITPYALTDDEYTQQWLKQLYVGKKFKPDDNFFLTKNGERVRSKSEKIIADALYDSGIPYRYEAPLRLTRRHLIYPDFTILNPVTRHHLYLEHFGLMDDPKYADNAVEKLKWYAEAGYTLGHNLFYLMETKNVPFPTEVLYRLIKCLKNAD